MNTQGLFDKVVEHLLTQNKRAAASNRECRYRVRHLRCAVGCLISDIEYNPNMEGHNVAGLITGKYILPKTQTLFEDNLSLLTNLQDIHDLSPVETWKEVLKNLADTHELVWNRS